MFEREHNYCSKCKKKAEEIHEVTATLEDGTEAEYTAYCIECGTYLYTFCYGHIEH